MGDLLWVIKEINYRKTLALENKLYMDGLRADAEKKDEDKEMETDHLSKRFKEGGDGCGSVSVSGDDDNVNDESVDKDKDDTRGIKGKEKETHDATLDEWKTYRENLRKELESAAQRNQRKTDELERRRKWDSEENEYQETTDDIVKRGFRDSLKLLKTGPIDEIKHFIVTHAPLESGYFVPYRDWQVLYPGFKQFWPKQYAMAQFGYYDPDRFQPLSQIILEFLATSEMHANSYIRQLGEVLSSIRCLEEGLDDVDRKNLIYIHNRVSFTTKVGLLGLLDSQSMGDYVGVTFNIGENRTVQTRMKCTALQHYVRTEQFDLLNELCDQGIRLSDSQIKVTKLTKVDEKMDYFFTAIDLCQNAATRETVSKILEKMKLLPSSLKK